MAGLIFGGVDFSGLGFEIASGTDSVRVTAPQVIYTDIQVPGLNGLIRLNPRLGPRQIFVEGYITGLDQSSLMGNVFVLESYLLGSLGADPDPINHTAPTYTLKDLVLPSFGGKKFQNCECETWSWSFLPGRIRQYVCRFNITFRQIYPYTVNV